MNERDLIWITEAFVKESLKGYDSGHDWWHIARVRKLALYINEQESLAGKFIVEITSLLHDSADSKFSGDDPDMGYLRIYEFMGQEGLSDIRERVIEVIRNVSFSKKSHSPSLSDPLLHVIQDADRLDAIGAIGIARAFNYGGFRNNAIFDPQTGRDGRSTIAHFYQKLLRLEGMMNTATGRKLARKRHETLVLFLEQFHSEWDFSTDQGAI